MGGVHGVSFGYSLAGGLHQAQRGLPFAAEKRLECRYGRMRWQEPVVALHDADGILIRPEQVNILDAHPCTPHWGFPVLVYTVVFKWMWWMCPTVTLAAIS